MTDSTRPRLILCPDGPFPRALVASALTWSAPVAQGQGDGATTVMTFAPVEAKCIRITQTATVENAPAWSIQRLRLYQPPGKQTGTR